MEQEIEYLKKKEKRHSRFAWLFGTLLVLTIVVPLIIPYPISDSAVIGLFIFGVVLFINWMVHAIAASSYEERLEQKNFLL